MKNTNSTIRTVAEKTATKGQVSKVASKTPATKKTNKAAGVGKAKTIKKTSVKEDASKKAAVKRVLGKKKNVKKNIKNTVLFDKKITDKLKKIVSNYTEYPELLDNIERETTKSFIDELNIDSVDFVEIIVDVEQEFDISIEDDEIYELKSFEDLYLAIENKIKGAKSK